MSDHVEIRPASGTWVVRAGGAVLGESDAALKLMEGDYPSVIYFPRGDIAMDFLDRSDKATSCPHKGEATHYSIVTKSTVLKDAAWSYEAPIDGATEIASYMAFYPRDEVAVEQV